MNMMTGIHPTPPDGTRLVPPIALLRALPPGPLAREHLRLQRLAELFAAFDRNDMEAGVDLLLAELDARDGDPEIELNGDEEDGNGSEDDFTVHSANGLRHAGCPIADPEEDDDPAEEDDSSSDVAWIERSNQATAAVPRSRRVARQDDGSGQAIGTIEDAEADGDEQDGSSAEDDFMRFVGSGPGCPISDPGGYDPSSEPDVEYDGPHIRRAYRDRIRRTRCRQIQTGPYKGDWRFADDRPIGAPDANGFARL